MREIRLMDEVTRDTLLDVVRWYLEDMHEMQVDAQKTYEADREDTFHEYMAIMFQFAEEMLLNRLETIEDDEEEEEACIATDHQKAV